MSAFFEDIVADERIELGSHRFTAEEIVDFAGKYDPQPFHLSEEGAAATHFGRLCASGWHTAAVFMKLFAAAQDRAEREARARGEPPVRRGPSPGFENLKWLKPVYAGDTISYASTVTGKTESRSRPDWGIVHARNEGVNQHGDLVFSFDSNVFVERCAPSAG
ncbi:MaoC family dehydratase [Polymorphum gilvum]|uniref:MaoC-like dehydratase n=1 Tax=Polymorphum gilvum (strain LMG 25793 / CGMCC 1.9160 / SL003B-26A1) TaxID=991905 RepID=F2IZQ1_POLGS|nr:MaoC family dehydratase [Polymorphum gilvum]ADZ69609.1 MaoC-like dehydratase [Polymorphum gilvum SL003B-26A1]